MGEVRMFLDFDNCLYFEFFNLFVRRIKCVGVWYFLIFCMVVCKNFIMLVVFCVFSFFDVISVGMFEISFLIVVEIVFGGLCRVICLLICNVLCVVLEMLNVWICIFVFNFSVVIFLVIKFVSLLVQVWFFVRGLFLERLRLMIRCIGINFFFLVMVELIVIL